MITGSNHPLLILWFWIISSLCAISCYETWQSRHGLEESNHFDLFSSQSELFHRILSLVQIGDYTLVVSVFWSSNKLINDWLASKCPVFDCSLKFWMRPKNEFRQSKVYWKVVVNMNNRRDPAEKIKDIIWK